MMAGSISDVVGWCAWLVAVVQIMRPQRPQDGRDEIIWRVAALVTLVAFRWPHTWAAHEQSPDESQSLAGALTLWTDPLFWRSVDGATAGPLHYFLLMPAAVFGPGAAYARARLLGQFLVLCTLFMAGRIVGRATNAQSERVAVMLGVTAYAFTRATDLQHTSTEVLPAFLITLAIAAYLRPERTRVALWIAGIALGLVPWAKLQAAPLALGLGLFAVVRESRANRAHGVAQLVIASLAPTLVIAIALTATGLWSSMIIPYVLANSVYAAASRYTFGSAATGFASALWDDRCAALWLASGSLLIVLALILALRRGPIAGKLWWAFGWFWFLLALGCVLAARRPFLHYWHFLAAPWLVLTGLACGNLIGPKSATSARNVLAANLLLVAILLLPLVAQRLTGADRFAWVRSLFERTAQENREIAASAQAYVTPHDRVALWGNRCSLYLALGLPQATRQAHTEMQIRPGKLQGHFLQTYWEDFSRHRPALFADVTGPGNLGFDYPNHAHSAFPPLAEAIQRDYTLVLDRFGVRLFVRNDRLRSPAQP
jgi:hypothetical protein